MATRIDIELTSTQDDGTTFTWRAAGARQPKGVASASLFPAGAAVGDEFKVEAEMNLDGIEITQVIPTKAKPAKTIETLELIGRDDEPLVTQQLAPKGRGDRRDRKGGRGRGDGDRKGGRGRGDGDRKGGRGDGGRPRTPAKPKLPPKPKPPRLKAGKTHRNALLAELPDEERVIADQLLAGGLQAVRSGLATENEQRAARGESKIDDGPIVILAEKLLARVRAAEWLDRAEAAVDQAETVDLRDLRSVVTAADGAAKSDETRALAATLRQALADRLDADHHAWIAEVIEMLDDDRVVRALHLSSRPPKAGAPLPAPVAMRLVEASNAAMTSEITPDRWGYILDALAHSPVRRQVVPASLPAQVTPELKATIARHGQRLPEIAEIFGVTPDPKAGGNRRPRRGGKGRSKDDDAKGGGKAGKSGGGKARTKKDVGSKDGSKDAGPKDAGPKDAGPKATSEAGAASPADVAAATGDTPAPAEMPTEASPETETPPATAAPAEAAATNEAAAPATPDAPAAGEATDPAPGGSPEPAPAQSTDETTP